MRALVYGAMNPDIVHEVDDVPGPGDDVRSRAWLLTFGGKAANAAVALATWEVDTTLTGLVLGLDPLGAALLDALKRSYLDCRWIESDASARTGHCVVLLTRDGNRTIVCAGYGDVRWQEVPSVAWGGIDVVLLDGLGGDAAVHVGLEAVARGIPVVWLDAPMPVPVPVELVVWSRHEHGPAEAEHVAGAGVGVVLTASGGVVEAWWRGARLRTTPPQVKARDATGAGDVFAAACARGVGLGWRPQQILTWAAAAGAAVAARGRKAMPPAAVVDRLAQR